jgi:hypothetical protein
MHIDTMLKSFGDKVWVNNLNIKMIGMDALTVLQFNKLAMACFIKEYPKGSQPKETVNQLIKPKKPTFKNNSRKMYFENCVFCGLSHNRGSCTAYKHLCKICSRTGHFDSKCFSKNKELTQCLVESGVEFAGQLLDDEDGQENTCNKALDNNEYNRTRYMIDSGSSNNHMKFKDEFIDVTLHDSNVSCSGVAGGQLRSEGKGKILFNGTELTAQLNTNMNSEFPILSAVKLQRAGWGLSFYPAVNGQQPRANIFHEQTKQSYDLKVFADTWVFDAPAKLNSAYSPNDAEIAEVENMLNESTITPPVETQSKEQKQKLQKIFKRHDVYWWHKTLGCAPVEVLNQMSGDIFKG